MLSETPPIHPNVPAKRNAPLPVVTLPKPRCPQCQGALLKKYRSISDQGDGSSLAWVKCRNEMCGHRFKVLLE